MLNICDCLLFAIRNKDKKVPQKKNKVSEKYNFNKPIGEYYKKKDNILNKFIEKKNKKKK